MNSDSMALSPHEERCIARLHEMGPDRRLRVQCLCNYMEEAAGNHAAALGMGIEKLAEDKLAWVLARMRLRISSLPGPRERFRVETWPVAIERLQFRRDFIACDEAGKVFATAVTQWVIMGLESRRVERIPARIAVLRLENPRFAQESGDIRIPAVGGDARPGPSFPVRLADIDWNGHVNNGRYVDFALEAADTAGMRGCLRQLDVIFRAEALRGDIIGSKSLSEAGIEGSAIHSLFRQGDGQELARARTVWAPDA